MSAAALSAAARIVVTRRIPQSFVAAISAAGITPVVHDSDEPMPRRALLDAVTGASGLLCVLSDAVNKELLDAAPSLKVVSTLSVGYNHVDVAVAKERGVRIGNTPGVLTEATADLVLALTLASMRRIPEAVASVKEGGWTSWKPYWMTGKSLAGARVGIVGMGRIGTAVARRFKGFGCSIQYHGASGPKATDPDLAATYASLDDLLATSDVVVLLCALTPETRSLMTRDRLLSMKPDATLINAARGEVVDQDALIAVLKERPDFFAGLDVTTPEPLPTTSELLKLPNCTVLPHIGSATAACREEMTRIAVENAIAGVLGADLVHEVKL